ncbi:MAG: type II secretion system protein GspE, partial [Candidatus Hydrogenedentales bacterium]
KHPEGAPPATFVRGRGCGRCKDTGYRGRVAVIEAMVNYQELQELIMTRAPSIEIKRAAVQCGMRTLRQNALEKAAEGLTTIEEVLRVSAAD